MTTAPSHARFVAIAVALVAVAAPFWSDAIKSLGQPGYLGTETVLPTILVAAGVVLLAAVLSLVGSSSLRRIIAIGLSVSAVALVAAAAVAGRSLSDMACALLMWAAAFGAGSAALRLFRLEADFSILERGAFAAGLGLGFLSQLTLLLGVLHLLYPAVAFGLVAVIGAATLPFTWRYLQEIRTAWRDAMAQETTDGLVVVAAVLVFLSIGALQMMAPAVQFDDLHYHLYAPLQHVTAHGRVLLPDVIQSYFYQGEEMLSTLALLMGGETTAIVLNGGFAVLTTVALAGFAARVFSREAARLTVLFWITLPLVAWSMTTGYVDVASAFYAWVSTIVAFGWMRRPSGSLALLAGVFAAFAVGVKLNAALYALALVATITVASALARRVGDSWRFVASFSCGGLIAGCVWPALLYVETGNPVFPFMNGIFRAPGIPPDNWWANFSMYGMGNSVPALLALPWNLSAHGDRFIEALHPMVLGPSLLLAIVAGTLARPWHQRELRWAVSITALYVLSCFLRVQYLRYLIPVFPLIVLIAGVAVCRALESLGAVPKRAAHSMVALLVVCPSLVIWMASYFNIPERVPYRVIFGLESRDRYRARIVPVYAAFKATGSACSSGSGRVLTILNEYGYLCPEMVVWNSSRASFVYTPLSDTAYQEALRTLDIAYVVIDDITANARTLPFVASGFLDRAGQVIYHARGVTAIRLLVSGERPTRQTVRAEQQTGDAGYRAGLLEPIDPTFENDATFASSWAAVRIGSPTLDVGSNPTGYPAPAEGNRALHINLPGPSKAGQEEEGVSASFSKAVVHVEPGQHYEYAFDLLCSGLNVQPAVTMHFTGADGRDLSMMGILVDSVCDGDWRRFSADVIPPPGAAGVYPEFGFTFSGDFPYGRHIELDRLGLTPRPR